MCCFLVQTVEKWTLREIQAQYRAAASANLHPPPIPVRRNVGGGGGGVAGGGGGGGAQPGSGPGSGSTPSQQQQKENRATNRGDGSGSASGMPKMESRSAPSSPTEKAEDGQQEEVRDKMGVELLHQHSSTVHHSASSSSPRRPRSMAVEDSGRVQYTTISFPEGDHSPAPPARRGTNYSNIRHQPARPKPDAAGTSSATSATSAGSGPDGDGGSGGTEEESGTYANVGGACAQELSTQGKGYSDFSPPPVPVRFSSQELGHEQGSTPAPPTSSAAEGDDKDKQQLDDPFASQFSDPFSDSGWSDPSAFYDKPRSVLNSSSAPPSAGPTNNLEDGYMEIGKTTMGVALGTTSTADFTGDSSYEDTSSFLQGIHARFRNMPPEEVLAAMAAKKLSGGIGEEMDGTYSVPPVEPEGGKGIPGGRCLEDDAQFGSYDFPSALNMYPFKEGGGAGEDPAARRKEEPPLHTIQYPVQKSPQPPARSNIPLPPIPQEDRASEPGSREDPPPPLPARLMGGGPAKSASPKPSAKDNPLPPLPPPNERPRLPPYNHPWGNKIKKQPHPPSSTPSGAAAAQDGCNPPLPPRKKPQGGSNGHPGESGGSHSHEDPAMLELIGKGYQRADIESALRIAKNDFELAKSILKEFGGRH